MNKKLVWSLIIFSVLVFTIPTAISLANPTKNSKHPVEVNKEIDPERSVESTSSQTETSSPPSHHKNPIIEQQEETTVIERAEPKLSESGIIVEKVSTQNTINEDASIEKQDEQLLQTAVASKPIEKEMLVQNVSASNPAEKDIASFHELKESISPLMTKEEIIDIVGEPSQIFRDAKDNRVLWRYDFSRVDSYKFALELDAVDVEALKAGELSSILFISFAQDGVTIDHLTIYYQDENGRIQEYRQYADGRVNKIPM